jgi:hypothetical protein
MIDREGIRLRWELVGSKLDERGQRLFAAGEARAAGWSGKAAVAAITGLALFNELDAPPLPAGRVRRPGGGRQPLTSADATLLEDLRRLIEPATLGSPMRPLLWVSKSCAKLSAALRQLGHKVSTSSIRRLLPRLGYSRQSNRKAEEGSHHPIATRSSSTSI